jgi:hypothetical protein
LVFSDAHGLIHVHRKIRWIGVHYNRENSATLRMKFLGDTVSETSVSRIHRMHSATLRMKFLGDTVRTVQPFE